MFIKSRQGLDTASPPDKKMTKIFVFAGEIISVEKIIEKFVSRCKMVPGLKMTRPDPVIPCDRLK